MCVICVVRLGRLGLLILTENVVDHPVISLKGLPGLPFAESLPIVALICATARIAVSSAAGSSGRGGAM